MTYTTIQKLRLFFTIIIGFLLGPFYSSAQCTLDATISGNTSLCNGSTTLTATATGASSCSPNEQVGILYNLDDCAITYGSSTSVDYGTTCGVNLTDKDMLFYASVKGNSCGSPGAENSFASMCGSGTNSTFFRDPTYPANGFNFTVSGVATTSGKFSKLSFYISEPTTVSDIYSSTKFGIRITDPTGSIVYYEQAGLTVPSTGWQLFSFDFSNDTDFNLSSIPKDYKVFIQGYAPGPDFFISGGQIPYSILEIDQVRAYYSCPSAANTTYSWSGPNGFTSSQQSITASTAGTYYVTVRDCNGCSVTKSITVTACGTCAISTIVATPTACNSSTNTYSTNGAIYFTNPPTSGTLTVSDGTATKTFSAPFTSPLNYTLTGLTANGATHTVTASFSAANCYQSTTYTAPQSCSVVSCNLNTTISGNTTLCSGSTTLTANTTGESTCSSTQANIGFYSLDGCDPLIPGTLTPTYPQTLDCVIMYMSDLLTYNDDFSCTSKLGDLGAEGSYSGTCVKSSTEYSFNPSNGKYNSFVFDAVSNNGPARISKISFYARGLTLNPDSYATKMGVRILKNGVTIFEQTDITVNPYTWTPYTFDVSSLPETILGSIYFDTYTVIVQGYYPNSTNTAPTFEMDQIRVYAQCGTASGSTTYAWTGPNGFTSSQQTITATTTGTYTVTVRDCNGCTVTKSVTVTPPPTPTVAANPSSICSGSSATLTVSNCSGSVTWNDGTTGLTKTVSPTSTTTYTATCSVGTCTGTATSTVTVTPKPTPTVNNPTICAGSSATLTVSNCSGSVTWNDGTTGLTKTVSPTSTTTYTATCSVGTCTGTATSTVTVTPKPTPIVNNPTICTGSSATLTVSNCSGSVTWNDGVSGASRTVSPTSTTTYTATCSVGTCTGTATSTVTVTPKPTPTVNNPTICAGSNATLTVSNCSGSVTWNDGTTGLTKTVSPISTTTYTATCSVGTCTGTATSTVTVTPKPTPTPTVNNVTICTGGTATLTVSNCNGSISWNTGATTTSITVSPTITTNYTVSCTEGTVPCTGSTTATGTVTVSSVATPTPSVNSPAICVGQSATLTVNNCSGTVTWNDGTTGLTKTVSPTSTTSYTATCTVSSGSCSGTGTATSTVTVTPKPTPTVNSPTICAGSSATLTVANCSGSVTWNDGTTGLTKTVSPTATISYTATCSIGTCTGTATSTATVTPKPTPTVNSPTICAGSNATLTVSNCSGSVTWNDGTSGLTKTVSPTSTTTYTATCSVGTCTGTATSTVTVTPKPTPTVNSPTICEGSSATLTVSNCSGSVTWNDGTTGLTKTVSPISTTTYTATCSVGTCTGTATSTVTVTPKPTPTPTINNVTICTGGTANLTVSNCNGSISWNTGATTTSITVNPTSTTSYTVTCTEGTAPCIGTATATGTVTVSSVATPTPSVNSPAICVGQSATLTVNNCSGTVTWNDGTTGLTKTVSPTSTTSYTATCTVSSGSCSGTGTATSTVTVTPNLAPTVNSPTICSGSSATLTVSNCSGSVTWNDGTTGLTKTVSPTTTTTYTATCSVGTCTGTATSTVTVSPNLAPTVNSPTICSGSSATLTVSNCSGSVTWNDGTTGLTKTVSPTSTTTYTATCSVGTCTGTATSTVTVTPKPTPTVNNPTICTGSSATLTVSNCSGSVTWNDGTTGLTKTVSPTSTTTYTATCSVGTCTGTAISTVTVTPKPTPTVNSPTICSGSSATLTVSNCSGSVTWNDGTTGLTKTVSPTSTTTYTATCSVGTCTGTATSTVTVTPKPTPTVNNPTICTGSSATLTVSNCSGSVTWNDGTTGLTKTVSPTSTTTYTATCSVGTCTGTAISTVTVTPKPTPTVNNPTICAGSSATLTVSNCSGSVTWNDGTTGLTKTVSPTSTTTYTATCSVGTCTGTATSTVTVSPNLAPTVNSPTICAGSSATLTVANCSGSVTWNDGTTGLTKTVSPTSTNTYMATCSVGTCTGTATSTVTVSPNLAPTVNSPTICAGSSATLTVSNCSGSVTWNDGTAGLTKTVSPTSTTSYTATCSVGTCTGMATSTVTVTPKPTPTVNSPTICAGSSTTLTVSNCSGSVTWNDGTTGLTKTVSPATTTTYTATCSVGTCTGTAISTVTVSPNLSPTVNSPTICAGSSATLTVSNCSGSVTWNDGTTGLNKTVSPTTTTTYTATCSVGTCSGTATSTVTVTSKPTVNINTTITCSADLTTYSITFTSNGTVTSDKGTVSGTTVSGIPTGQTVTLTASLNGCTATASATKSCSCPTINPPVGASKEICEGDAIPALTVNGDAGLQADWYSTATSTTKLSTGLSYTPTVAGDFYVEAVNPISGCKSATRTKVSLVVNPKPTLSTQATCATDGLTYSVTVTTNATSITADKGTVSGMSITGIPSGQTVTITATSVKGCTTTATANQSCIVPVFDLALMKKLATGQTANVVAGGTVKFTISIINQGNVDATNVQVSDYIPTGLTLNDANWTATSGIATLNTPITSLAAGQTVTRDITFTVGSSVTGTITNFAEISSASNALNLQDVDSTPDANATNDGTPKNDVINENGKTGGDEDDHDLESINVTAAPVFDLALMKKLATGQTANVVAGGTVKFTISIINQGNVDATNVQVSDYIPTGLTLNDANWTATTGIATLNTPITSLAAGQTVTRDVTFTVGSSVTGTITNFAEISSASNALNLQDVDSTPDANATNDGTPKNDVINENGKTGGDEDDHDLESINVSPSCVLPTFKVASPSVCATNTWSVSISVSQAGNIKINKGTLSGSGTNYTISNIPAGTSLVMMDSLSVSCKKDTIIAPPISCNCITSPPVIGQNLVACKGDTFPTLKATVVGYGTVDWYKQSTGSIALAVGTLSYKPAGTITVSDTFYLAARNLVVGTCPDPSQRTILIVTVQNCIDTVDLHLTKKVNTKIVKLGDVITYTIKVWNESTKNATGVEVTDQLPAGVQYVSSVASRGNYNNTTGVWIIRDIAALSGTPIIGDTVTLSIQAKVIAEGVTFNTAEISKTNEKDIDSTPSNGIDGEDDLDRVCITTPIKLCAGQGVDITIPSTYTGIVWKDAQGNIVPSSGNSVTFTKAGTYTFTATNGSCPTGGCCPVIIEEINCCPAQICIPLTITKKKK